MKSIRSLVAIAISSAAAMLANTASGQTFQADVAPLIEASCLHCHDADTETGLNLEELGSELANDATFSRWERIFDRVRQGEMPPASEKRPEPRQLKRALTALGTDLRAASLARQQRVGRVPARRLTKLELGYTLQDLLLIESDVTSDIPDEVEAGSFDTVGSTQRISAVHMESYLQAADDALRQAMNLGSNPYAARTTDFRFLEPWHDKPANLGGSITRKLQFGDGVALFRDVDYLTQFQFQVTTPGTHRISARIAAYQSTTPVTAKFIVKGPSGAARLVKAIDLEPREPQTVVVDTFLQPGDRPYLTFDMEGVEPFAALAAAGGSKNYKGRGLAIMMQKVEGPLTSSWPPPGTRKLLAGVELQSKDGSAKGPFAVKASKDELEHVTEIVRRLAPEVFRREVSDEELAPFIDLARPAAADGRPLPELLRLPLRSMLSSPQFLLFGGKPGTLDDDALASRLSYFLWKSQPDGELHELARRGKLSDDETLAAQVDRMLEDEKSERFVRDFLGQWLRLHKVDATTPDEGLYPEYDELLGNAIPIEPELFFTELIKKNLSLGNLIDADFTFVNRRLARLYGLRGVKGQEFRRIELPESSPRGGVLTQAAILKTTANGTTTSPVTRGNFVLTNFLGTPPAAPPPDVGSIEPDTRGKTTIREILAAHRDIDTCNACHRSIDPPGFALESFDPIGRFRTRYRVSGGERKFGDFTVLAPPKQGRRVDPSGVTADGQEFSGIDEFKQHLMGQKEQVARNFISQLVVYSTGGEIQFADRDEIEAILERTRVDDYRVRDIIHEIVQSRLFRNQ